MARRTNTFLNSFRSLAHNVMSGALATGLLIAATAGGSAQDAEGESTDLDVEVVEPKNVEARQEDAGGAEAGERMIIDIREPGAVVIERPEGTEQPVAGTGDAAVGTPGPELTENIVDRVVVNTYGEEVGEISALVVEGRRITHAVLSIGGFLGIGGNEVVVPFDAFDFSENGEITIETVGTGDQLEDLRPFEPAEFGVSDETSGQEASDETQWRGDVTAVGDPPPANAQGSGGNGSTKVTPSDGSGETLESAATLVLLVGVVVVVAILLRAIFDRTYVPALVSFMALGILLQAADSRWALLTEGGHAAFDLLSRLGIVALLFRIGLESNLKGLLDQLPRATVVWIGNILLSGVPGYLVMSIVLGYGLIPSLIAAVALTATSVGVSLGLWEKHKALKTRNGALVTDVAEMDDLSGVAFMALLFAVVPVLRDGGEGGGLWSELLATGAIFLVKFLAFAGTCVFIGRYVERRVTTTFGRLGSPPELMVLVAGIGILIAGVAEWLGMSAAIGALFAGIIFSRDPDAVNIEAGFRGIFHLLAPFFFVGIGLQLELSALGSAVVAGSALVAVAILGKLVGAGLPALVATGAASAMLIAVSMVPRAEITLIIMSRGRELGDWAVPPELYAAFLLVSAVTCVVAPVALEFLFRRWPQEASGEENAASAP